MRVPLRTRDLSGTMWIRKLNEGEVESDAGFRVRIGHSRLTYFEGGASIPLDAEHMADGTLVIYGVSPTRLSDAGAQRRVIENVRSALTFLGVKFEIDEST